MRKNFRGEYYLSNNMFILFIFGSFNEFEICISKENIFFVYEYFVDECVVMLGVIYGEIGMEIGNILILKSGCLDFSIFWLIYKVFLVKDYE